MTIVHISYVPNYKIKTISSNSCSLKKIINLINHTKSINYLYYYS